jgi:predicted phosphate transport protein (TIGR00153 family)
LSFRLKPRDDKFFKYFNDLADAICEASLILKSFVENRTESATNLDKINEVEERGDLILSEVMKRINNSFITPFDREDILMLARELNNVVDHVQGTMEKIVIYKVGQPKEDYVLKLVQVLEEAAHEIKNAVGKLPDVRSKSSEIIDSSEKIRSFEHEGDYLYRAGIALLFENTQNVIDIIKWKEIYEHLETTLDYCENVSNILKGVAIKYV